MTLTPAYGRDYKNKKELQKDFDDNKEYLERCEYFNLSPLPCNHVVEGTECSYALVSVSQTLAKTIMATRKQVLALRDTFKPTPCCSIDLWDCSPHWVSDKSTDDFLAKLSEEDCPTDQDYDAVEIDTSITSDLKLERTESDILVITGDCFYWRAYPKHCNFQMTTHSIPISELEDI